MRRMLCTLMKSRGVEGAKCPNSSCSSCLPATFIYRENFAIVRYQRRLLLKIGGSLCIRHYKSRGLAKENPRACESSALVHPRRACSLLEGHLTSNGHDCQNSLPRCPSLRCSIPEARIRTSAGGGEVGRGFGKRIPFGGRIPNNFSREPHSLPAGALRTWWRRRKSTLASE